MRRSSTVHDSGTDPVFVVVCGREGARERGSEVVRLRGREGERERGGKIQRERGREAESE